MINELSALVDTSITARWPAGMRLIVRREHPHPGAALSLFEHHDGWRYQVVATNTQVGQHGQLAFLEARHRAHARVEDRIRHAKDTGLSRLPSREYAINQAWIAAVTLAADLTAWLRLLALPDSLKACEPKAFALPTAARPSPAHPRSPTPTAPVSTDLAVGRRRPGNLHQRDRPRPRLTATLGPDRPRPEDVGGRSGIRSHSASRWSRLPGSRHHESATATRHR